MIITKGIVEEDFINYKSPSMVIMMPFCDWKCGIDECQNSSMARAPEIAISAETIVKRYIDNPITKALIFSGLEPILSFEDIIRVIEEFRKCSNDPVVIYTGYNKDEILEKINILKNYENIIIKFGRYIPRKMSIEDRTLGVVLASNNQYAEQIS